MVELDLENAIIGVVLFIGAFLIFDSILGSVISFFFSVVSLLFSFALFVTGTILISIGIIFIYGAYKLYKKLNDSTDNHTTTTQNTNTTQHNTGDDIKSIKEKYAAGEMDEHELEREVEKELN